ncbi:hypothetical protein J3Q64DRAFT_1706136, partial [Phycomyces blakesleeanus]
MLPQEIISIIADNLSTEDRLICTSVCKSWKDPFQESLWKHVEFKTRDKFDMFYDEASQHDSVYHLNGQWTEELSITCESFIKDQRFQTLLEVFPNIKSLTIFPDTMINTSKTEPGQIFWKSLTFLRIIPPIHYSEFDIKTFSRILSFTPNVKRLEMVDAVYDILECTWKDIDVIHDCLPLLEHLEIAPFLALFESTDTPDFSGIKPTRVTSLTIPKYEQCIVWVNYFAHKYPNINPRKCSFLKDITEDRETKNVWAKLKRSIVRCSHTCSSHENTEETED